jgi:thymidylate kinase
MIVIELTGIPGAGKTTLMKTLKSGLETEGISVLNPEALVFSHYKIPIPKSHIAKTLVLDLLLSTWAARAMGHSKARKLLGLGLRTIWGSPNPKLISANLLRNFVKKIGISSFISHKNKQTKDAVIIWDEGLIHTHQLIFVHTHSGPDMECLKDFFEILPTPDLIVGLNAPIPDALEALATRGSSWRLPGGQSRLGQDASEMKQYLTHAQTAFSSLLTHPKYSGKLFVLNRDEAKTAHKIINQILTKLPQPTSARPKQPTCN